MNQTCVPSCWSPHLIIDQSGRSSPFTPQETNMADTEKDPTCNPMDPLLQRVNLYDNYNLCCVITFFTIQGYRRCVDYCPVCSLCKLRTLVSRPVDPHPFPQSAFAWAWLCVTTCSAVKLTLSTTDLFTLCHCHKLSANGLKSRSGATAITY